MERPRHIVSLGSTCEPANFLKENALYTLPSPFDWFITPYDSLLKILDDDGARLGTEFAVAKGGTTVLCRTYGVLYHHEFERGPDGLVLFDAAAVERCRSRLLHKMNRVWEACAGGDSITFIRWSTTKAVEEDARFTAADINALVDLIASKFPSLDFKLAWVRNETTPVVSSAALDKRVILRELPYAEGRVAPEWHSPAASWKVLLKELSEH